MQKFIVLTLVWSFVFQSTVVFAQTTPELDVLQARVTALQEYVTRLTVQWNPAVQKPVAHDEVRTSITNGVSWLVASQEESGHFAYEYLPYEDKYREDDNIVRQAGALYALAEVARKGTVTNRETNEAIEKAIDYFETLSPVHEYEDADIRCIAKHEQSKVCKLGATALALIGIIGYVEANPEKEVLYKDLITEYTAFILASKKADSGFRDQYTIGTGFQEQESSFSNGEALLALVRGYQYKPSEESKRVIDASFTYLEKQSFDGNLYLWIMAALKDMNVLWPNASYTEYGKAFTLWRLAALQQSHGSAHNYCAANEGFASAYTLLEKNMTPQEKTQLRTEIDFWNTKNTGLQIGTDETLRAVLVDGQLVFKEIPNLAQSSGGFLTSDAVPTQRIDFTQHCINTYLQTLADIDKQEL